MDFLQGLNPQQKAAAAHVEGPLLLLAGAGSGKTRVITHRIAHLVEAHHVPGPCILAVTFTNKAADEMRQRVNGLLGTSSRRDSPVVSTFHSFCVRLLRRDADRLAGIRSGFTRNFTIYDADDQVSLIKAVYRALGLDEKFMAYRAACSWISHNKSHKISPQDFYKSAKDPRSSRMAKMYEDYENRLRQANAMDFDDLLLESVRLLQYDQELREQYNRRFEFVMIDEYQDTNRSQYDLMRLLTDSHRNICVVGDEDQSIYGWRGANIHNILDFEKDFPGTTIIRLEQNYRSTKMILEAASAVVAHNKQRIGKSLWTESGPGDPISIYQAYSGENEALFVADTIERLLSEDPKYRVAVLYRTNFQSRQIEEALRRYNRAYLVVGGVSFYQRAEVKDMLAYLRVLITPQDSISLLRIINTPARGIGKTTVESIEEFAGERHLTLWEGITSMLEQNLLPARAEAALSAFRKIIEELTALVPDSRIHELLNDILERTGYKRGLEQDDTPESESRLGNLNELLNAAAEASERGEGITEFLDHAALVADADALDARSQVCLLTMHNAKGLEFPIVFITGMEDGLFPHTRALESADNMEEERRLCYVAMTRAEKRLFLSYAKYRRRFGGGDLERCKPSLFLNEVPKQLTRTILGGSGMPEVNLYAEQHEVRATVQRNLYTGKTYNSVDNINQFFAGRANQAKPAAAPPPARSPVPEPKSAPQHKTKRFGTGSTIQHPKYGRGTVMRREGEGEDAKLTVSFPGYGLKKLVQKYAGLKDE